MEKDQLSRRLAVILHADVVGSTSLVQQNETLAHERIQAAFHHFSETIKTYGGIARELRGDALVAEFERASDAVPAALAFQALNKEINSKLDDKIQPQLRIGISLGEVIIADNTITGAGVVLAQRLEQLADPGGVVVQGSVSETVPARMPFEFKSLGEQMLKGFDQPVRAFAARLQPGKELPAPEIIAIPQSAGPEGRQVPDKPSIAVLPFTNMSDDPEQEYFSDGITEDITTALSYFTDLFVIARNSSFSYKGQRVDARQIARELGVRYLLEGSVRRLGNRIRINSQLVNAITGGHIWAERFDGNLDDIFELQDEITRKIVASIAPQIELAEVDRSQKLSNTNLSAYELALKAQALTYDAVRVADRDMLNQAMSIADKALKLDKMCTHALWTRGMGCVFQYLYGWSTDPGSALNFAIEVADHLIGIEPANAKSYIVRAWAYQYRREYDLALADYRRALELNPNLALNLFTMAWSEAVAGLPVEARKHAKRALVLSPRDTDIWLAWAYATLELSSFIECNFSDTVKWGRLAIQLHARMPARQLVMIAGYGHLGDVEAASSHISAIKSFAPETLSAVLAGKYEIFKLSEHNSLLLKGLRQAGLTD